MMTLSLSYQTLLFLLQDITSHNPYLTLVLVDQIARTTKWWHYDITAIEGTQLETPTTNR